MCVKLHTVCEITQCAQNYTYSIGRNSSQLKKIYTDAVGSVVGDLYQLWSPSLFLSLSLSLSDQLSERSHVSTTACLLIIQKHIIQNRNLQQLQSKQLRQRAQSVAALSSLKRKPMNRILNLVRILLEGKA